MARKLKQARWSYAEDRRLLTLAKSSKSPEEIARLMNSRGGLQNGNPLRRPVKARRAAAEGKGEITREGAMATMLHLLLDWEYPRWMMMAGAILVAAGLTGSCISSKQERSDRSVRTGEVV